MSQARQTSTHRPPTTKPVAPVIHDTELVDEMQDFLDEVDAILEEEDGFLLRFRQRGGQ